MTLVIKHVSILNANLSSTCQYSHVYAIGKAATMLSGAGLQPVHVEQMSLPGHFSGCGARNLAVSPYADAAYWAMWSENCVKVRDVCAALSRPVAFTVDAGAAEAAKQTLLQAGVACSHDTTLSFTEEALGMYTATPWNEDMAAEEVMQAQDGSPEAQYWQPEGIGNMRRVKYLSRLLRGLDALKAARMWTSADQYRRTAMLSAGGLGTGVMWQLHPAVIKIPDLGCPVTHAAATT